MPNKYSHIFLNDRQASKGFTTPRGGREPEGPQKERAIHSVRLKEQWDAIWATAKARDDSRSAVSKATKNGVYIEFEGEPGYQLITKSLESRTSGIRLLHIYQVPVESGSDNMVTRATVFIPSGKQSTFLKKLNDYADKEKKTITGNPKHEALMQSIHSLKIAMLESFWSDTPDLMPNGTDSVWCEIWLSSTEESIEERFRDMAKEIGIELQERILRFPERSVLLGKASKNQLSDLIEGSPDIAELRRAKETARFFLELTNKDQTEWIEELSSRLSVSKDSNIAVCILDTGANNGHALLAPVLSDADCQTVEPDWDSADKNGHGTLMCGLAAYGDLTEQLQKHGKLTINHRLESVKILPSDGVNDPELYGELTIQGISRAEIQEPKRTHINCMAVTSEDGRDKGRPSSWSAAIDKVTSGYDDNFRRLFIVSAGNIQDQDDWIGYPESNKSYPIHDPGQSWNAVTVGAYTTKSFVSDPELKNHIPLAEPGQLSPFSSTSCSWERKWPIKPEIVMEGGNLLKAPDGMISLHDDLSLLSTCHKPTKQHFDSVEATSAATAQAGRMAAQIQTMYPDAWPETIRGLLIHSSDWPDEIKRQFCTADANGNYSKSDYGHLLKICGYGVPDLDRALTCVSSSLTLISEASIQPYEKKEGKSTPSTKDMHIHNLPWPKEELLKLGHIQVKMKVTLSYFIEPGPGEVGWKDKYRYASHGLRFGLNRPGELEEVFVKRLNAAAREEDEKVDSNSGSDRWTIGANSRNAGSIHSDIWTGNAADIADCNLIGVYPVIGWWRERPWLDRWDRTTRYTLIVSLETPGEEVDIYTPVTVQLEIPVEIIV